MTTLVKFLLILLLSFLSFVGLEHSEKTACTQKESHPLPPVPESLEDRATYEGISGRDLIFPMAPAQNMDGVSGVVTTASKTSSKMCCRMVQEDAAHG